MLYILIFKMLSKIETWNVLVVVKLPKYAYDENYKIKNVMKLACSLYGLENAARIWNDLITDSFKKACLKEAKSASCVLSKDKIMVICYVMICFCFRNMNLR